jgi:hypothetical protein
VRDDSWRRRGLGKQKKKKKEKRKKRGGKKEEKFVKRPAKATSQN